MKSSICNDDTKTESQQEY